MTNTKKKHGNKMKLMSAIGMLTVSAAMLVSSTFAWFSMNKSVTAQTMTISAKSESPYLLISKTSGTTGFDTSADITDAVGSNLLLTAPLNTGLVPDSITSYYASSTATSATTTLPASPTGPSDLKWGYAVSDNPAQVQADNVPTLVANDRLDNHRLADEVWLKLQKDGADATNLTASCSIHGTPTNTLKSAVRVLMITDNGNAVIFKFNNSGEGTVEKGSAVLASAMTAEKTSGTTGTVEHVSVYVYFDGTDTASYTNNATDLTGVEIDLGFEVDFASGEGGTAVKT